MSTWVLIKVAHIWTLEWMPILILHHLMIFSQIILSVIAIRRRKLMKLMCINMRRWSLTSWTMMCRVFSGIYRLFSNWIRSDTFTALCSGRLFMCSLSPSSCSMRSGQHWWHHSSEISEDSVWITTWRSTTTRSTIFTRCRDFNICTFICIYVKDNNF